MASKNTGPLTKKQKIFYAALAVFLVLWLIFFAIPDTIKRNEQNAVTESNNQLIRQSFLTEYDTETKLESDKTVIREPWIAIRKDNELSRETTWTFLCSSIQGKLTEKDLAGMKTLILCQDYVGKTSRYTHVGIGAGGTYEVTSMGVCIRCIDLETGRQIGNDVFIGAKELPKSDPSESDRRHRDSDVRKRVQQLVESGEIPGQN